MASAAIDRANVERELLTKTMRLPRYAVDALRLESAMRSNNSIAGKVTEQKIVELALIEYLKLWQNHNYSIVLLADYPWCVMQT